MKTPRVETSAQLDDRDVGDQPGLHRLMVDLDPVGGEAHRHVEPEAGRQRCACRGRNLQRDEAGRGIDAYARRRYRAGAIARALGVTIGASLVMFGVFKSLDLWDDYQRVAAETALARNCRASIGELKAGPGLVVGSFRWA